jgi:peptide/nickel transport system permease protein
MSTTLPAPTNLDALTRRRRRGGGFFAAPSGWLSVGVLVLFTLTAIFGPMIVDKPGGLGVDILQPPSLQHWFGTDDLGQDVFAQVVWGTRVSMTVGVAASIIAILIGTALGMIGAYVR